MRSLPVTELPFRYEMLLRVTCSVGSQHQVLARTFAVFLHLRPMPTCSSKLFLEVGGGKLCGFRVGSGVPLI